MPQTQERLFVVTASNPDAKRHIERTMAHSIDPSICAAHFPASVLDEVRRKSADGQFYAWGARPGEGNQRNWNALQPRDRVLVMSETELFLEMPPFGDKVMSSLNATNFIKE